MLSRAAERSSGAATKGDHRKHKKHSEAATTAAAQLPHSHQQQQQNAKKSTGSDLFQTPTPTKKVTFGMRHVACMLYITHYLSISHVPISPLVSIIDPLKVVCHFFVML
jgi:hypothetical protein